MRQQQTLMIQGCTSDAGKTTFVAGLCRVFARKQQRVAPFKPQNMALNSAVTSDGGEIGRAQALQAQACGIASHTDMNPILIKPSTDTQAQVIVQGKALVNLDAAEYQAYKAKAMSFVLQSYQRLSAQYEKVFVEGAGSPAEINLRENDIANMGFAEAVDCPVIIIADIDKGGVFAHLVGTLDLLSESEKQRVIGFVINKFRGDLSLLQPGLDWLEQRTQLPVFGVMPFLNGLCLDAEDAIALQQTKNISEAQLRVVVPAMPRISNHTDFDTLRIHPQVDCHFVGPDREKPPADLVILPGSKAVMADLQWLRSQGWESYLKKHIRYGGKVIGICGGMQMLGEVIDDPHKIESGGHTEGFSLLPLKTVLNTQKTLVHREGRLSLDGSTVLIQGYEIHHGVTRRTADMDACIRYPGKVDRDGWLSQDQQIFGCYLHGLFDNPEAQAALLGWSGLDINHKVDLNAERESSLNRLADSVEAHIQLDRLEQAMSQFYQVRV